MPKLRPETLREVDDALRRYEEEIESTALKPNARWTYVYHARNFVRWLNDEFNPGETLVTGRRRG